MNNSWIEVSAKTVDEAITEGLVKLGTTMEMMEVDVLEKESSGFLGFFGKHEAKIRVRIKEVNKAEKKGERKEPIKEELREKKTEIFTEKSVEKPHQKANKPKMDCLKKEEKPITKVEQKLEKKTIEKKVEESIRIPTSLETVEKAKIRIQQFLSEVFQAMQVKTELVFAFDKDENELVVDIKSDEMGILIGKRGQTLDSLQYIVSLVANKDSEEYLKIKLDSENYRTRRKETLENLAKNIANKVKRTGRQVVLEPMNSFERRIIHSALQLDEEVETYSEGNDPYRKVVVKLKGERRNYSRYQKGGFSGRKPFYKKPYGKSGDYRSYQKSKKFEENESFDNSISEE